MTKTVQNDTTPKQRRFPKNPYRNILVCAKCGAAMRYEQSNLNGANPYVAYVCSAALKPGKCSHQRTRFTYVDSLVRQALESEITMADRVYERIETEGTPAALDRAEGQYQGKNVSFCVRNILLGIFVQRLTSNKNKRWQRQPGTPVSRSQTLRRKSNRSALCLPRPTPG